MKKYAKRAEFFLAVRKNCPPKILALIFAKNLQILPSVMILYKLHALLYLCV